MSQTQRQLAVQRLVAAREELIKEIAGKVNEHGDSFSEDFNAGGYRGNEVEELLEKGDRLVKLGYLIAHMQADHVVPPNAEQQRHAQQIQPQQAAYAGAVSDGYRETAPGVFHVAPQYASWDSFVSYAQHRNLRDSANELSRLLGIDLQLAVRCTAHFASCLTQDYDVTVGALNSMTAQLRFGNPNGALSLLHNLFNLQGDAAIAVYTRLKDAVV